MSNVLDETTQQQVIALRFSGKPRGEPSDATARSTTNLQHAIASG